MNSKSAIDNESHHSYHDEEEEKKSFFEYNEKNDLDDNKAKDEIEEKDKLLIHKNGDNKNFLKQIREKITTFFPSSTDFFSYHTKKELNVLDRCY